MPLGIETCSSRAACSKDLPARARKMQTWERWLLGILCLVSVLYSHMQSQSKEYIEATGMFNESSVDDWHLVWRAGIMSRRCQQVVAAQSQLSAGLHTTVGSKACFFADVGMVSKTLVVPIGPGTWRDSLEARLQHTDLPEAFQKHLVSYNFV